jgi:hypothetical protein
MSSNTTTTVKVIDNDGKTKIEGKLDLLSVFTRYYIPPDTVQYMKWGQTIMVIILFGAMFISILFAYVYANYTDYQNRISVITNAYLFGENPQRTFEQYMKNSQGEVISAVMNDIQSSSMDLGTINARLDSSASRLSKQVTTEVPDKYAETNSLGISIQKNIAKLRDTISKLVGSFVLGNYITKGALTTVNAS